MKIEVNIKKKYFFAVFGAILLAVAVIGVRAYNPLGIGGNPSTFGHSADELAITLPNGSVTTLSQAITNNYLGGGAGWRNVDLTGPEHFVPACSYKYKMGNGVLSTTYTTIDPYAPDPSLGNQIAVAGTNFHIWAANKWVDQASGSPVIWIRESCPAGVTGIGQ